MRLTAMRFVLALWALVMVSGLAQSAQANKLDLAITRFITCQPDGTDCIAHNVDFEQFMMEYAYGLSPTLMSPAETLGYSGFYLGLEGTLTPRFGNRGLWERGTAADGYPDAMFMPSFHVRKGLPWSFEIGGTLSYLAQSELVALGGEVKWSLFEGYRHGFRGAMPDIAARGKVMRVMGQTDVDMTIVGVDGSISYPFGIGGMVTLTPYAGFQYLFTIIRVEPLVYFQESTGDFMPQEGGLWDTDGLSQPNLGRAKIFGGLRFGYEMLSITIALDWGIKKKWDLEEDDISGSVTDPETEAQIMNQIRISGGVGMDF